MDLYYILSIFMGKCYHTGATGSPHNFRGIDFFTAALEMRSSSLTYWAVPD